jgi:hypothetical protein
MLQSQCFGATWAKSYKPFVGDHEKEASQLKTPLLDRRGAETDERSESDEAGWWNSPLIK